MGTKYTTKQSGLKMSPENRYIFTIRHLTKHLKKKKKKTGQFCAVFGLKEIKQNTDKTEESLR